MSILPLKEIERLANKKSVKKVAVENFLMSLSGNTLADSINMGYDADMYNWNSATINAIKQGINLSKKYGK